jgi:3-oxoacyl-[acyl-carrier-protein] synthase II
VPVSSTKSAIGHLLGAAGAVEGVATVLALATRVIPPTLGYEVPDAELDLDYVPGEARPLLSSNGSPPVAISNSFAFGGHNVALTFRAASA